MRLWAFRAFITLIFYALKDEKAQYNKNFA